MKYDIFISYRREGGYDTAKHLNDLLVRDGYRVSFDIDTLRNGDFDIQLLSRIEECKDFILIVDKHAFDRTLDQGFDSTKDWMRCELAHALKHNKNIIPVFLSGVTGFPDGLPDDIVSVTKKNGPEYNRYYFNDFYETLKKRFLHKRRNHLRPLVLIPTILLLIYLIVGIFSHLDLLDIATPSNNDQNLTLADKTTSREDVVNIEFYSRDNVYDDIYDDLFAKVDDVEYKIDLPKDIRLNIIEQRDFDMDGVDDVLVENVQAFGGNGIGNSYFFVKYSGDGFFKVSNEFGLSVWERPTIEIWNGVLSVLIIESNVGMNREEHVMTKERYILKHGEAEKVETLNKQGVTVVKEVRNTDFKEEDDENKVIVMEHDLNNDGINEKFLVKYWARWNSVLFDLIMNDIQYSCHYGDYRVGISHSVSNGYYDIVLGDDIILKWNGKNYMGSTDDTIIIID